MFSLVVRECGMHSRSCDEFRTCVTARRKAHEVHEPCPRETLDGYPPSCSPDGTRVVQCDFGRLTVLDCTAFGLECTMVDGKAGCSAATPACEGRSTRCDGAVAVGCMHGHEIHVDCAAGGLACSKTPGAVPVGSCFAGHAETNWCDPADEARCDGAAITYCSAGRKRRYSCETTGFAGCVKDRGVVRCGE
jgi:hypothetical protein